MSEISANVKMYALIAGVIGLIAVILSFTFGMYPFLASEDEALGITFTSKINLFGSGEMVAESGGVEVTTDFETGDWESWPTSAAWIAWIGFLIVFIAGVVYYLVRSEMMTLEGQDANLALGIMIGGALALIGMIWWMMVQLGDDQDLKFEDFGYGFYIHFVFAIGAAVLGYLIWTEEK